VHGRCLGTRAGPRTPSSLVQRTSLRTPWRWLPGSRFGMQRRGKSGRGTSPMIVILMHLGSSDLPHPAGGGSVVRFATCLPRPGPLWPAPRWRRWALERGFYGPTSARSRIRSCRRPDSNVPPAAYGLEPRVSPGFPHFQHWRGRGSRAREQLPLVLSVSDSSRRVASLWRCKLAAA
jgi:hypothetical protein